MILSLYDYNNIIKKLLNNKNNNINIQNIY